MPTCNIAIPTPVTEITPEMVKDVPYLRDYGNDYLNEIQSAIRLMQKVCFRNSYDAGWWHNEDGSLKDRNLPEMLFLLISEVVECGEGVRKDLMDDKLPHRKMEEVELADLLARLFDYAEGRHLDISGALMEKLQFNANRADHKPENRYAERGKKF